MTRLVDGYESSDGLELLATVHWTAREDCSFSIDELVDEVYLWSQQKSKFSPRQIAIAYKSLQNQGWVNKK